MHLLRLLLAGVTVLKEGHVPVRVERAPRRLLAIKRGEVPFDEVEAWRLELHRAVRRPPSGPRTPDRPDYAAPTHWLLRGAAQHGLE